MSKVHIIKKGETLSELALLYNTDTATLKALNSQQIKDIDLIYAGNTLSLPDKSDIACWDAADKNPDNNLSANNLFSKTCSINTFVDVLYVPSMLGEEGKSKQQFLFLTEEAKQAVEDENTLCSSAVNQKDKTDRVKALGELGLMDAFNSFAHEAFLSSEDKKYYLDAMVMRASLLKQMGTRDSQVYLPEDYKEIGVDGAREDAQKLKEKYERQLENLKKYYCDIYGDDFLQQKAWADYYEQAKENFSARYTRSLKLLQKDVCQGIERKIEHYESMAKQEAKQTKLPQGELTYHFTDCGYYSSNTSSATYDLIKTLLERRSKASLHILYDIKSEDFSQDIVDLDRVDEFYSLWKQNNTKINDCLSQRDLTAIRILRKGFDYKQLVRDLTQNGINYSHPMAAIVGLNLLSVAVKEQCLSENELLGGKDDVNKVREIFEEQDPDLRRIKTCLSSININTLGFYPAYVLQLLILKDVAARVKDFADLVGVKNEDYIKLVKSILPYAQQCAERVSSLRSTAESNKSSPSLFYKLDGAKFEGQEISSMPVQLVWDETNYRPEDLSDHLFASSGENSCHIVECSLASQYKEHKTLYLRSNCAILSSDSTIHKNHVKSYAVSSTGSSISTNESITYQLGKKWSESGSVEWKDEGPLADVDDVACFPWIKEKSNILGVPGTYDWSASAQFMRFVNSANASLSADIESVETKASSSANSKSVSASSDFGMKLILASGKSTINARFPAEDAKEILLPYISRSGGSKTKERNIGSFIMEIVGTVYGAIAASMTLSNKLQVGNKPNGQFGIRGVTSTTTNYAEANFSGAAFAGLKVGGSIDCKFKWKPTESDAKSLNIKQEFKDLFKIGGGVEAQAGIGGKCTFSLTYQKGRFLVVLDAGLTSGLGCEGKVAAEINPENIDDLFTVLINLMTHSDFKRFAFIDEEGDEDETFKKFNDMITVAVMFGLSFGELALIPFKVVDEMQKRAREERNAPFVANFLLDKENIKKNEAWIKNMPAETLSKLLTLLVTYHVIPGEEHLFGLIGADTPNRDAIAEHNAKQIKAILKIFEWLGAKGMPSNVQLTRFENAVQRMGLNDPTQLDNGKKWEFYAENLLKIKAFFDACLMNKYNLVLDDDFGGETYNQYIKNSHRFFVNYIHSLTIRNGLYQKGASKTHHGAQVSFPQYVVLDNRKNIEQQGYKQFNWENLVE
ncbi:LysM peptidoglycan-binding domain-containing protein [Vibrio viridaestus]|uniref:LysM domain-containing protein n=1 Tax=Vibrio viridaestus TaxID=2487322 RepID=A0A3N9TN55_9VIBR|nr:LysM domain-containing protein [Vibrio viridaestus]RQW65085.1 LysM domain-containing protein [Vibrio viridaestus]